MNCFPKDMIKNTMRDSNIETNMIGEQTQEEIEEAKLKLIQAKSKLVLMCSLKKCRRSFSLKIWP